MNKRTFFNEEDRMKIMKKQCWICSRTPAEVIKLLELDGSDQFLRIVDGIKKKPECGYNYHSLRKGSVIYICYVCHDLISIVAEDFIDQNLEVTGNIEVDGLKITQQ